MYYRPKIFLPKSSYSMFGEDVFIEKFFKKRPKGVYVDVGSLKQNEKQIEYNNDLLSFDVSRLKITIQNHVKFTKSEKGKLILSNWEKYLPLFVKITPFEFKRALNDRKEKIMINKIAGE